MAQQHLSIRQLDKMVIEQLDQAIKRQHNHWVVLLARSSKIDSGNELAIRPSPADGVGEEALLVHIVQNTGAIKVPCCRGCVVSGSRVAVRLVSRFYDLDVDAGFREHDGQKHTRRSGADDDDIPDGARAQILNLRRPHIE